MVPLILTTALIQWFIPIKLDLDNQARAEQVFQAKGWWITHWPRLDTDSAPLGALLAVEGLTAWKQIAINSLGMGFLADVVCLLPGHAVFPVKDGLQIFGSFKNLRILMVDFSQIDLPELGLPENRNLAFLKSLKELRSLELLGYPNEDINTAFRNHGKDFANLKMLNLSKCQHLRGEAIPALFSCPSLLSLRISRCDLVAIPKLRLEKPFKLKHLQLDCKKLDKNIWDYVANCPDLEELSIHNAEFTGKELAKISGLQKLITLKIYQSALTNQDLLHLGHFKNLKSLKMGGSKLGDQGVNHLVRNQGLEVLGLEGNGFTDECLSDLKKFKNLHTVYLLNTEISEEGKSVLMNFNDGVDIVNNIDVDITWIDNFLDQADFPSLINPGSWLGSTASRR